MTIVCSKCGNVYIPDREERFINSSRCCNAPLIEVSERTTKSMDIDNKILRLLKVPHTSKEVAEILGIEKYKTRYHIGKLREEKLVVEHHNIHPMFGRIENTYESVYK